MSNYNYEALNPETFQKFAQALIVAQYPDTQCLPVGQPDGGRDAHFLFNEPDHDGFIVFQVKFSRSPLEKNEREVVQALIESEKEKVDKLIQRGAIQYYLITNVRGTAHLDTGSIDKCDNRLKEVFAIPSYVWWRDDLDARLDNHTDVKWSYPQICKGTDVLGYLRNSNMVFDREQSSQAINAYCCWADYSTDPPHLLVRLFSW